MTHLLNLHNVVGEYLNCLIEAIQYIPTTYVTEIRTPILKYTFIKNHIRLLCLFKTSQAAYQY